MLLLFFSCYQLIDTSAIYMTWKGNWSISHEKILNENSNKDSVVHINDYWGIVTKLSISDFRVDVFESPNNTNVPIFYFSTEFVKSFINVKDGNSVYTYNLYRIGDNRFSISGKFRDYTFHIMFAGCGRYQVSVFDFNKHEWNYFNLIKDIDRHDPTWFEEKFWLGFGYVCISIFLFILFNYSFNRFSKLSDAAEHHKEEVKKLPRQEFEDVLTPGYVKKRKTFNYEENDK